MPRRLYTQAHMDVTAETAWAVYARRKEIRGLRMVYEPKYLRFGLTFFLPSSSSCPDLSGHRR
jgi:tyrosine phenol-lyase